MIIEQINNMQRIKTLRMKKSLIIAMVLLAGSAFGQKKITKTGHAHFLSETAIENIEANNYKVTSTLSKEDGAVVFSVPMQSFEFENSTMQKHYNSPKFLDTKKFPKATFKGKITNLSTVEFSKNGTYKVDVTGTMTMHGESKDISAQATLTVNGETISGSTNFELTLADYKIAFEKGKPSTNIAKTIKIDVKVKYD